MRGKINAINAALVAMLVFSVFLAIPVQSQVTAEMYFEPGYIDGTVNIGDVDGDVDRYDLWGFMEAFVAYYKTGSLARPCDIDVDQDIDCVDLWTLCASYIAYYTP